MKNFIMMVMVALTMMFTPAVFAAEKTEQKTEQTYVEQAEYYGLVVQKVMESFSNSIINIATKMGMAANDLIFSPLGIMLLVYLVFKFTFIKIFGFGLFITSCLMFRRVFKKQKLVLVSYDQKSLMFGLIKLKTNCVYQTVNIDLTRGEGGMAFVLCGGAAILFGVSMCMMFT
jgi:hypothetical protein